jgi:hypothetical protein
MTWTTSSFAGVDREMQSANTILRPRHHAQAKSSSWNHRLSRFPLLQSPRPSAAAEPIPEAKAVLARNRLASCHDRGRRHHGKRVSFGVETYLADANSCRWSIFIGLFIIVAFCIATWFLAPKGENQTYDRPGDQKDTLLTTLRQCLAIDPHNVCYCLLSHVG